MGSREDVAARIDQDTIQKLEAMKLQVAQNKEQVNNNEKLLYTMYILCLGFKLIIQCVLIICFIFCTYEGYLSNPGYCL